jgi:hypothetical protein
VAGIPGEVVDAEGDGLALRLIGELVLVDLLGLLAPGLLRVAEVADQLLLFGVHVVAAHGRWPRPGWLGLIASSDHLASAATTAFGA